MKRSILSTLVMVSLLLIVTGCEKEKSIITPEPTLPDLTLVGDLRHADSGTDFLGLVYLKSGSVYYNEAKEPGVWTGEVLLGTGSDPRIEIDGNDNPHVVYTTSDGKIAYRTRSGGTWNDVVYIETNNAGTCSKPDIALDVNGYAHVTYTDSEGYLGGYYIDTDDIMYAVNSSGTFVKSVIWRGYYDSYGDGSNGFGMYFTKGSRIAVNGEGRAFIITHNKTFLKRSGVSADSYFIAVESGVSNGSVGGTLGTDSEDIYDLAFDGTNVIAFYKAGGVNQTAALTISEAAVSFVDTVHVTTPISNTYLNTGTLAVAPDLRVLGGTTIAGNYFFAKLGAEEMIINEFVVKSGTVPVVLIMGGVAYGVYTDTSGTIRIGKDE